MANVQIYNDDIKSKLMNYVATYGRNSKQNFDSLFLKNWELENSSVIIGVSYSNGKVNVPVYHKNGNGATTQKIVFNPNEGKTTKKLMLSLCDLVLERFSDNAKKEDHNHNIEAAKKTVVSYIDIRKSAKMAKDNLLRN